MRRRSGLTRRQRLTRTKLFAFLATGAFVLLVIGILSTGVLFAWYAKDLPRPDRVRRTEGLSTIIFDRHGAPIYDIFRDQNRIPASFDDMPQMLRDATIAIEDKDFYQHEGYSSRGMMRAMANILFFRNLQGGSTLTQQLVKNVLLTSERTLPRKMKEFILAVQIERRYDKDEILQMYLNEAPYGSTTYGIEAAAQYYFNKQASDLTDIESILLAGFPQAPSRYSPFTGEPEAYKWRAEQVLRRLREDGKITREEEQTYRQELDKLEFAGGRENFKAAHFVQYVRELLVDQFGQKQVEEGGLRVTTSLDLKLQEKVEEIVSEEVEKVARLDVGNGAAVVLDPNTGEILAMVGSKDYEATDSAGAKFNVVTQGLRQPGSALKPITYAQAFREGMTPSTIVMDVATEFPGGEGQKPYAPKNYDLKWRGPVQLRFSLANSINMSAVKVLALTGVEDMLSLAYEMGLSTLEPTRENMSRFGLAVTLGGGEVRLLELANAYSVLANLGVFHEPTSILKVSDQKDKTLYEYKPTAGNKVLNEDISFLITDILSDNEARSQIFGSNSHLNVSPHVFVKTGTTDDKRDNWTLGGSQSHIVGVWVGNNDNSPMHPSLASGVTGAAPIWNRIMRELISVSPPTPFAKPDSVVEMGIDAFGGGLPRSDQPTRREFFIKGTEPTETASLYQKLKLSRSDNSKLANEIEISTGAFEEREFIVLAESDPVSSDGKNRWQEGIEEWLKTQTDPKFHPPTEVSSSREDKVVMNITSPQDKKQYDDHDVKIAGEAFSLGNIKEIIVYIDGKEVDKRTDVDTYSRVYNLDTGAHIIRMTAKDDRGKEETGEVKIGVKVPWDTSTASPNPSVSPTPVSSASP